MAGVQLQVWSSKGGWKIPAFTNICPTFQRDFMTEEERKHANLANFPGYFEVPFRYALCLLYLQLLAVLVSANMCRS
jgi:hypothetical protein